MTILETDRERIIQRLLRDVEATLGPGHEMEVRSGAANAASFADDIAWYRDRLVEEVQQYFHDCFIDTTWPRCPHHPNHPLWLHGESWYCERDDSVIAKLGELTGAHTKK